MSISPVFSFAFTTDEFYLTEDTFSATTNNESTDTIISESILLPVQRVGWDSTLIERAHEISFCGNSVVEFSEKCDKNNFLGKTCADFGKNSGSLSCSSDCNTIITTACTNVVNPTPTPSVAPTPTATPTNTPVPTIIPTAPATPIPTIVPTSVPTGTPTVSPTNIPTPTNIITNTTGGNTGGGGGGYNPLLFITPTPSAGVLHSVAPTPSSILGAVASLLPSPTQKISPWLNNGDNPNPTPKPISPWLENGNNPLANSPTSILPFEEWRQSMGLDAFPESDEQKQMVTKHYIAYVQSELDKGVLINPVRVADMLDTAVNPERYFGDSEYWLAYKNDSQQQTIHNIFEQGMHSAPHIIGGYENGCSFPWIWLLIAFLFGMLAEYIIYKVFFSQKYEKQSS